MYGDVKLASYPISVTYLIRLSISLYIMRTYPALYMLVNHLLGSKLLKGSLICYGPDLHYHPPYTIPPERGGRREKGGLGGGGIAIVIVIVNVKLIWNWIMRDM